ncbi:MAG: Ig-like domain-containing protein, partial [Cyanobacteria bacterium P01_G01_bin.19]
MSNKNSFTTDSNSFENQNLGDTITPNIAEENTSELNTNNSPGAFSDPLKPLLEPVLLANTSQDFLDFNEMEETEIFTGSTSPDTIFVEPDPLEGDADGNLEINIDDVRAIFGQRNSDAVGDNDVRDIDRNGKITVLDARKLVVILRENNDRDAPDLNFGLNNDSGNNSDDFITSDPTISGTIEDLSQVTSLIARFEGTPLEDATEAVSVINEDGSFIINKTQLTAIKGSPLEDGEHTLYLQAKDKWGNKTQQLQVSFVLDTTPPQVFVPDLIANPQINSESQLVGTVDEEVASLTYSFAGQEAVEVAVDGLEFAQSFDLTNLESGTKTLTIIATDLAGNTTTQTLDVEVSLGVVDVTPPEIEAVLVNDTGSSTSDFITSNPTIMGIVNDESEIANLSAGFNDSLADITATLQSDSSFSLSEEILKEINGNNSLDDGEYTLNLIATDVAGNQGSTEISFTLDTTNPLLNADLLTDTGIDGDDGLTNDPTISGSVSDANAIASLTASLGDNTIDVTDLVDASGNFNLDATKLAEINNDNALEDREYTLELVATDIAGNESISTVSFILDTTAPELLVSSPAANSNLADGNQLTGTVNEDLASLVYQFDNQQVELELTNGEFSQELDLTGLADGQYSLTIIATDKAGNVSEETIAVNLDTTPDDTAAPIINAGLVTDTGSSNVDGITSIADIAGTVTDESAIASLTASLGGNTVDVTDLIDVDGNFNLNEVALAEINDGNALEDGTYTLELVATDAVGNVSTSTVNFTLDTTNPLLDAALVVDSGVDDGDGLTNNPAISGTVTINNAI